MLTQIPFNFAAAAPIAAPSLKLAFRSGMSRDKDFTAAAAAGVPIGVVAGELTTLLKLRGIPNYLRQGGSVFVDSGAFQELSSGEAPDFDQVLRAYECMADLYNVQQNERLYLVSPDKVGDQLATLDRLTQYANRVRNLIELGCQIIVPLQRGVIPAVEMLARVQAILGTDRFVVGIPSNKEALSIEECATLKHPAFHILGRVQLDQDQVQRLQALGERNPGVVITADANWLRSRLTLVCNSVEAEARARAEKPVRGMAEAFQRSKRSVAITAAILADATWGKAA